MIPGLKDMNNKIGIISNILPTPPYEHSIFLKFVIKVNDSGI